MNTPPPKCPTSGKLTYTSSVAATEHVDRLRRLGKRDVASYPCPWCPGWHVTSHDRRSLIRRIRRALRR
jgi:hypothetical protein